MLGIGERLKNRSKDPGATFQEKQADGLGRMDKKRFQDPGARLPEEIMTKLKSEGPKVRGSRNRVIELWDWFFLKELEQYLIICIDCNIIFLRGVLCHE